MIWRLALAAFLALCLCAVGQQPRAQFNGCSAGFCNKVISGGGGVTGWCSLIPQSGLTNCWPFDTTYTSGSTAADPIGSKNAALTSVTLLGSGPSTNLNNAGVFNGTTSTALTTALSNAPSGAAFSVVIWINPTTINSKRSIANDNPGNNGFQILGPSNVDWACVAGNGSASASAATGAVLSTGVWHMVSCTYDGTTLRSYIDTTVGGTAALAGSVTSGSASLGFGYNPSYNGDFCPCSIAGIAIYSSTLSAGQVTTINGL